MRRCKALTAWLTVVTILLASLLGCSTLRKEDPLSSYSLPGDVDPDSGVLTDFADSVQKTMREGMGLAPNEAAAQERFAEAMSVYEGAKQLQGDQAQAAYDKAAKMFGRAALRWPNSSVEEDAMFFRGESYFFANRYPKAESVFGQLVSKYQSTRYLDRISNRRFKIAKYWLDHQNEVKKEWPIAPNFIARDRPTFDKFGNAIKVLEQIRLDDPVGELSDDSTMLAASACYEAGKLFRADELLADLRRSFPNSDHQYLAHMLGLQAKIKLYQGPSYDSGPLEDAEELVQQMYRQFPKESAKDMDFLQAAFKDIRMNRAIRGWRMAEYRHRRKEFRAARLEYERVAREFHDTSLASEAETRLAQIEQSPDLPPQRLEWLAKAFPVDEAVSPLLR